MSGNPKCPACVVRYVELPGSKLMVDPSCTGRPGWVRGVAPENEDDPDFMRRQPYTGSRPAAGTEGGATDGMGTRVVEWPGESEITRLRSENERMEDAGRHHASFQRLAVLAERARHHSEIARLRAEVEQLTKERDEALADRHARDRAVAEAVREAALVCSLDAEWDTRSPSASIRIRAIDLDAVIATIAKEAQG